MYTRNRLKLNICFEYKVCEMAQWFGLLDRETPAFRCRTVFNISTAALIKWASINTLHTHAYMHRLTCSNSKSALKGTPFYKLQSHQRWQWSRHKDILNRSDRACGQLLKWTKEESIWNKMFLFTLLWCERSRQCHLIYRKMLHVVTSFTQTT